METTERILFARKCDVTGEGMNEGYCIEDGLMYIKHKKDMIKHLRGIENVVVHELTDDILMSEYYNADYYYWTEWECESDLQYEEVNGELIELED